MILWATPRPVKFSPVPALWLHGAESPGEFILGWKTYRVKMGKATSHEFHEHLPDIWLSGPNKTRVCFDQREICLSDDAFFSNARNPTFTSSFNSPIVMFGRTGRVQTLPLSSSTLMFLAIASQFSPHTLVLNHQALRHNQWNISIKFNDEKLNNLPYFHHDFHHELVCIDVITRCLHNKPLTNNNS